MIDKPAGWLKAGKALRIVIGVADDVSNCTRAPAWVTIVHRTHAVQQYCGLAVY